MLLIFHELVVLVHRLCTDTKAFKVLIKLDENATDVNMAINDNAKEPGETNQNEVHDYKHVTVPEKLILHQEVQMLNQRSLRPLGLQEVISSHRQV